MNHWLAWVGTIVALAVFASTATGAVQSGSGDWSPTVNGVQGRVIITKDPPFNGTRMVAVFMELRNVSDVGTPLEIFYDPTRSVQCELVDAKLKPVAIAAMPADILTPNPYWLSLPYDSVLRLRVSVAGYGVPKNAGTMVQMYAGDWLIKNTDRGEYALAVSFSPGTPDGGDGGHRAWAGTLIMPKVTIPR